jgi:hypothetical protein
MRWLELHLLSQDSSPEVMGVDMEDARFRRRPWEN